MESTDHLLADAQRFGVEHELELLAVPNQSEPDFARKFAGLHRPFGFGQSSRPVVLNRVRPRLSPRTSEGQRASEHICDFRVIRNLDGVGNCVRMPPQPKCEFVAEKVAIGVVGNPRHIARRLQE